jgi:acetylornithine deacetylase/succinyl-diaminopimelate desuccinylase-like protein
VTDVQSALAYLASRRDPFLADLQALLRQPSIAAQGIGMAETAEMVAARLRGLGARVEICPTSGYPVVYGEIDAGARQTLVFYNHYDVQPPEPLEEWSAPPFGAEVRDGRIYARGVADNKGNLLSRLQATECWLRGEGRLPCNVRFVFEGEEEIGSPHLEEFTHRYGERLRGAVGVVWESGGKDARGRPGISCGVKGICYVELTCRGANADLHSSQAAIVPNPAWRLVQALGALKDVTADRCLVEGFYDAVRSPTAAELALLSDNPLEEERMKANWGIPAFIHDLHGLDLARKLLYEPTCTICGLTSGYGGPGTKTVLPRIARAKIDCRLVPDQRADDIAAKIRRHLDARGFADVEMEVLSAEHPSQSPVDGALAQAALASARATYGADVRLQPRGAGTGPMFLFHEELGLDCVSGVGCGHAGARVHAPDENVFVEDYFQAVAHVVRLMGSLA